MLQVYQAQTLFFDTSDLKNKSNFVFIKIKKSIVIFDKEISVCIHMLSMCI
jgi:hypothetical protein